MKHFKIEIKTPCDQNWNAMPKIGNGGFCSQCSKVVTDFAAMSDAEILRILSKKNAGEICGSFLPDQLKKIYPANNFDHSKKHTSLNLVLAGLLSLPLLSNGQNAVQKTAVVRPEVQTTNLQKHERIIRGKIFNRETKAGISATIKVYTSRRDTLPVSAFYTNGTGEYEILLPDSGLSGFFKITCTSENFVERTVVLDRNSLPNRLHISLQALLIVEVTVSVPATEEVIRDVNVIRDERIMGASFANNLYTERPSLPKRVWYKLKHTVINMFRNPKQPNFSLQ
ncbi:hypothetical protein CNR22_03520 [Sphingobacteriaceae bacterium]|nr:hypothetical protein CNR22_03520 [Sphingobacteriaceae bacterium]